ncbi:MAG: hypothetical protein ABIH41_04910 [Nanoarchaeota archaeon]
MSPSKEQADRLQALIASARAAFIFNAIMFVAGALIMGLCVVVELLGIFALEQLLVVWILAGIAFMGGGVLAAMHGVAYRRLRILSKK